MTNIKKHRFKTVLSVMLTLLLILSAVTFAVSAAEATAVGVRLTTDKEEYSADEDIALTLGIKNTGTDRLTDIAYNITAPDGYELKSGSNSGGELELLAGGTLEYNSIYSAIAATPDNPETSGSINPTIPLITGTVCIAALFMLHRKKAKNLIVLILCVTLSASALPLDVAAGAEVSHEVKLQFDGYQPEYDELCRKYDAEVAALAGYEDEYYTYTLKEEPVNDENTTLTAGHTKR